ncbi:MAG: type II toxin-antitoxin system HicA family toxin [Anaerolineae bacterium]|nr:type II toxin-antitoxin system HicA family toxin [Anaerolineae bacterium]
MKRHALLKHLQSHGCKLFREGTRHSIYWNPANRRTTAVPRHTEIADKLARKICKDLGIPEPK